MGLVEEVCKTYMDCSKGFKGVKDRRLDWKANEWVSVDEAIDLLKAAGVNTYNDFDVNCLKALPENSKICIAREGSVCLYLRDVEPHFFTKDIWNEMFFDEISVKNDEIRLWWD